MLTGIAHDLGIFSLAAGAGIIITLGGMWARDALNRRRPCDDVLNYIEPPRAVWLAPLRCTCPARLAECACAVDGVRNPRGAGRARMQPLGPSVAEMRTARGLPCPGLCRRPSDCSTPAVCRAVAAMNAKSISSRGTN